MEKIALNIHGYHILIKCHSSSQDARELLSKIENDSLEFKYHRIDEKIQRDLEINFVDQIESPRLLIPVYRSRGMIRYYCLGSQIYYEASGQYRALLEIGSLKKKTISFKGSKIAHDNIYLFILSSVGESLERRGWHRLHAVGFLNKEIAYVIPLPSGRGKSTFASWLLDNTAEEILGDETIFTNGISIRPFPIRRALRSINLVSGEKLKLGWPKGRIANMDEYGDVTIALFENTYTRFAFFWTFFWGIGNAQMIEYFIRLDNLSLLVKLIFRRAATFWRLSKKTAFFQAWQLEPAANYNAIMSEKLIK